MLHFDTLGMRCTMTRCLYCHVELCEGLQPRDGSLPLRPLRGRLAGRVLLERREERLGERRALQGPDRCFSARSKPMGREVKIKGYILTCTYVPCRISLPNSNKYVKSNVCKTKETLTLPVKCCGISKETMK